VLGKRALRYNKEVHEMTAGKDKRDKRFPLFGLDNPLRRLFGDPRKYCSYVKQDQTVADLGCGPGFYTFALAESVGPKGRVYAVDSDEQAIRAVERKVGKRKYHNIEAHASSAADLSFIEDNSVDFVVADGLLCSMAPQDHESAVSEMKRILKPAGKAFLQVAKGFLSYVDKAEWEGILGGFTVERRSSESLLEDRWALVSKGGQ
jgi:SAM-dependent methyltransferase